ncbi:MAG: hypothetical protein NTV70_08880 [Acidobacteria bacterium]|nr:hypothetical protein [Acidobacteriota bacterium]
MIRAALLLGACFLVFPLWAADVVQVVRDGDAFRLKLADGHADIDWVSAHSFRFRRDWLAEPIQRQPSSVDAVPLQVSETPTTLEIKSSALMVTVAKRPLRVSIKSAKGVWLLQQAGDETRDADSARISFQAASTERFFGLGPRTDPELNLKGKVVDTNRPFLLSSLAYGLYFPRSGNHRFDFASAAGAYSITAQGSRRIDFYFHSGNNLKEVLDQHSLVEPSANELLREHAGFITPDRRPASATTLPGTFPNALRAALHASLSGQPLPAFDLTEYSALEGIPRQRAEMLAAVMPIALKPGFMELQPAARQLRASLEPHLVTYFQELGDRGYPVLHPLPLQFPFDPEAAAHPDQFMLGDELLIAPLFGQESHRSVYLPPGQWTELKSGRMFRGRTSIDVTAAPDELPRFAKNGTIVPLQRGPILEIHYFPQLGAEYFLWEPELQAITQIHAAPVADDLRLEIEEKVGREYEFVSHHTIAPQGVMAGTKQLTRAGSLAQLGPDQWFHDASRSELRVRVRPSAGDDLIVNASFAVQPWFVPR